MQVSETDLDNNDSFLNDITDPRVDEIQQHVHTSLSGLVDLDRTLSDSSDRPPDKVDINLRCIPELKSARHPLRASKMNQAYSFNSLNSVSTFSSDASLIMISNFSIFT